MMVPQLALSSMLMQKCIDNKRENIYASVKIASGAKGHYGVLVLGGDSDPLLFPLPTSLYYTPRFGLLMCFRFARPRRAPQELPGNSQRREISRGRGRDLRATSHTVLGHFRLQSSYLSS